MEDLVVSMKGLISKVTSLEESIKQQQLQFIETMAEVKELNLAMEECVYFDVGGEPFHVSVCPLQQYGDHLLGALTSGLFGGEVDSHGYIFVDRDPTFFPLVLDYLREGLLSWPDDRKRRRAVQRELQFYGLAYDAPPEERPVVVAEMWEGDHFTAEVAIYNGASKSWQRLRPYGLTGRRMRWCSTGARLLVLHDPPGQTARVSQYDLWTDTVELIRVLPSTLKGTSFCDIAVEGDTALIFQGHGAPRMLSISKKAPLPAVLPPLPISPDVVCMVDGTVYVGGDDQLLMARLKGGPWLQVEAFLTPRSEFALLGWQGKLMALGNIDPSGEVCHAVELYDPGEATWAACAELPEELQSPSAAVISGQPYALHEFPGSKVASVPIHTLQNGRWILWGQVDFTQPYDRFHMVMVNL
eukprot:GGOE01037338.1.p1 GENE.GGOE01037338.1~~GGOE01037338.1.p1  ORF type:complete len:413 (+),score=97.97 GGOE01037338.1:62-1300(+)